MPAGGKAHGIQMRSQTVDVNISQVGRPGLGRHAGLAAAEQPSSADTVAVDLALPGPTSETLAKV